MLGGRIWLGLDLVSRLHIAAAAGAFSRADHVDLAAGPNLGSGGAGEVAQNDEIRLRTESCNSSNVMGLIVL